ncbi:hypothetical protein BJ742DRAFT_855900 [Cladochytrium replicatum]|nr:hypothetical protein BJ742DRAFT_855900 [Cladochytrium replicatum]
MADLERGVAKYETLRSRWVTGLDIYNSGEVEVQGKSKSGDSEGESLIFDMCEGLHSPARRQLFPIQTVVREYSFNILYLLVEAQDDEIMPKDFREIANGSYLQFNMGQITTNMFFSLEKIEYLSQSVSTMTLVGKSGETLGYTRKQEGNVVLIGDAAHAMLPCLGQGTSLALKTPKLILGRFLGIFSNTNWESSRLKSDMQQHVFVPITKERYPVWADLINRSRAAVPNFSGQQTATGFRIAIPVISYCVSVFELGSRFAR